MSLSVGHARLVSSTTEGNTMSSFEIHTADGNLVTWTHKGYDHAQTLKRELNTFDSRYRGVCLVIKAVPSGL